MLWYFTFLIAVAAVNGGEVKPLFTAHPHLVATGDTTILLHCSASDEGLAPPSITWMTESSSLHSWSHTEGNITHSYAILTSHRAIGHLYCQAKSQQPKRSLCRSHKIEITENHFHCGNLAGITRFHLLLLLALGVTSLVVSILLFYVTYVTKPNKKPSCSTVSAKVDKQEPFNNLKVMLKSMHTIKGDGYGNLRNSSDA